MAEKQPKICILFCGGATLRNDEGRLVSVTKSDDIEGWLQEVPELRLVADIEPVFVLPDGKEIMPQDWQAIADRIEKEYPQSDGFVVLSSVDTLLYTGSALSFMFKGLTKSVVTTGSALSPHVTKEKELEGFITNYKTIGIRANLINAVQVATMGLPEVAILFGNQLLRANRARKSFATTFNVFEADEEDQLGVVDFGIKLKKGKEIKKRNRLKVDSIADVQISVMRMHPGFREQEFAEILSTNPSAIIIHTYMQQGVPQRLHAYFRIAERQEIPVILYNQFMGVDLPYKNVFMEYGMTYEALYAKVHWALSQTKSVKEFFTLLDTDVAHEFGEDGKEAAS